MNPKKDATSFNQDFATLLNEDENFKVVNIKLESGQMIPKRDGLNRLAYSLSDYKLSYIDEKGIRNEKQFRKGDMHWHDGCAHSIKNTGTTEAEFILVSFKKQP